jgi:hypothetical protein
MMTVSPLILWITIGCLLVLALIAGYFAIKFALTILRVQDAIEESLDVLDDTYAVISRILEIPLFYDSKEVRETLQTIGKARSSILNVATVLTKIDAADNADKPADDNI